MISAAPVEPAGAAHPTWPRNSFPWEPTQQIEMASIAVINIPSLPSSPPQQPDLALDSAQQVLLDTEEAKKRRKREEMRRELEKIHGRIKYTLNEFESPAKEDKSDVVHSASNINFALIEDPVELYEMLADSRMRAKYYQHITLFVVGFEEKCDSRENLLQSLQEFFSEMQAGNTQQLLDRVSVEEVNFSEATLSLETALLTAQNAAERLLEIKHEMGKLISIVEAYPDTKKGRKKMEKALLKAQEEAEALSNALQTVQGDLSQTKEKCSQLQMSVEAKSTECAKLRKTAEQVKKLQATNDSLKAELNDLQLSLRKAKDDVEKAKSKPPPIESEVVKDNKRVQELEAALRQQKEAFQALEVERAEVEIKWRAELEQARMEHEGVVSEMRTSFLEQLKNLAGEEEVLLVDTEGDHCTPAKTQAEMEALSSHCSDNSNSDKNKESGDGSAAELDTATELVDLGTPAHTKQAEDGTLVDVVEQLKQEHDKKEKKLQCELNDLKSKSRKAVTALHAQLTEVQSKHLDELSSLQTELSCTRDKLHQQEQKNSSFAEQVSALLAERQSLKQDLEQSARKSEAMVQQLQQELVAAKERSFLPADMETKTFKLVNKSIQWSEQSGQQTPQSVEVPPMHISLQGMPPVVPMDEVAVHNYIESGSPLGSSSLHASLQNSPQFVFPTSLAQSATSMEAPPATPPYFPSTQVQVHIPQQHSLSMLGGLSHLPSHSSPPTHSTLTFEHPVLVEWGKAYECVLHFRDSLVGILSELPGLETLGEELKEVEVHHVDQSSQDISGQVMQMRFSLALLLHQMEQTIQESLVFYTEMERDRKDGGEEKKAVEELKMTVAQLKKKLRHSEDTHKLELQESKETIKNLSNTVKSMRTEMASLQHSMPENIQADREESIMFTRLDSQRNTKTLQLALDREQISPAVYQQVTDSMEEYLSVTSMRLGHMSRRYQDKVVTSRLVQQVQTAFTNAVQTRQVVKEISELEQRNQLEYSTTMDRLATKRISLAHSLTHTLTHIEKKAGVFLIKPVYTYNRPVVHSLVTPILRPLPTHKPQNHPQTSSAQTDRSTPHPSMRFVNALQRSRQSQQRHEALSCQATPPSRRQGRQTFGDNVKDEGGSTWRVETSRLPVVDRSFPPTTLHSPTLPRVVELDIVRHQQPDVLLSHLSHSSQSLPNSPACRAKEHLSVDISPSSLPPINVPSQTDQLIASVVIP